MHAMQALHYSAVYAVETWTSVRSGHTNFRSSALKQNANWKSLCGSSIPPKIGSNYPSTSGMDGGWRTLASRNAKRITRLEQYHPLSSLLKCAFSSLVKLLSVSQSSCTSTDLAIELPLNSIQRAGTGGHTTRCRPDGSSASSVW